MPFFRFLTPAWMACVCVLALSGAEPASPPEEKPTEPPPAAAKADLEPEVQAEANTAPADDAQPAPPAPAAPVQAPPVPPPAPAAPATQPAPIIITPDYSPLLQANAELSARMAAMERGMIAQSEREAAVYRDTNQLITIFGVSVAALGALALFAAGFLNYRLMRAMPAALASPALSPMRSPMVLPESETDVPGMERVRASGQRFQTKMNSLEARLAEMEHLSGIRSAPAPSELAPAPLQEDVIEEPPAAPQRERVIPVAGILVHKAETLLNLGKHDQALSVLAQALDAGAAGAEVHLARGRVFERVGKYSEALREYDSALNGEGNNTSALLLKAGVLNRQERFEEALACYERAIEANRASN